MFASAQRLLITGMMWCDMGSICLDYSFYMAAVIVISGGCGLRIEVNCRN